MRRKRQYSYICGQRCDELSRLAARGEKGGGKMPPKPTLRRSWSAMDGMDMNILYGCTDAVVYVCVGAKSSLSSLPGSPRKVCLVKTRDSPEIAHVICCSKSK